MTGKNVIQRKERVVSKVILEGFIEVPDEDLEIVKRELVKHVELTRNETGCIVFNVEQDAVNKNRFNVYEEFTDEEAFKFHQTRVTASKWGIVTKNLKRNYNISQL